MPETINDRIDRFINYFRTEFDAICELEAPGNNVIHYKRLLIVALLDVLSKPVYPTSSNRNRINGLICQFSGWLECNKISLPHLVILLRRAPQPEFKELRKFAYAEFSKWQEGDVISLDRDPDFDSIKVLWPKEKELRIPIEGIPLESLQHSQLFYNHRNALVHEFRSLGRLSRAPDWSREDPYYSVLYLDESSVDVREDLVSWELQYPIQFYERIINNTFTNLHAYLRSNRIDPMFFFSKGGYWIEALN